MLKNTQAQNSKPLSELSLEEYFAPFRHQTIGHHYPITTAIGETQLIYADWIASGRLYLPIENKIQQEFGPYVANTHTESSETGTMMTKAYHMAHQKIKEHVNAGKDDVIITAGFGMTGVAVKFQRILGLKTCIGITKKSCPEKNDKPVVFISHMEHHSNHTSWFETVADVVMIPPGKDLLFDLDQMRKTVSQYRNRTLKIGSFTACSNVTGIETPIHKMAQIMHENGGFIFADYAASAPYVDINMHPNIPDQDLDAIFFSPHKFLGGPGSSGVLIFNKKLYKSHAPDNPGGGTVDWTNAWGEYKFIDDIEAREDGGTPGFLQAIRGALAIELKNQMGTQNIRRREEELLSIAFNALALVPKLHILADNTQKRLGIISFYIEDIHFNLLVKLLNDFYGIQVRGGCACAGTYGHFLLDVSYEKSKSITQQINQGNLSEKPGWVRLSLHPTMTNHELNEIINALKYIQKNHHSLANEYIYDTKTNEFHHKKEPQNKQKLLEQWFTLQ